MSARSGPRGHLQILCDQNIFAAIKASLERLELEYVDVLQCHRFDPDTPIEETVRRVSHSADRVDVDVRSVDARLARCRPSRLRSLYRYEQLLGLAM
jgi:predicted oxidoreductase